jgi:hypothetical protein
MPNDAGVSDVEHRLRRLGSTLRSELATRDIAPAVVDTLRRERAAGTARSPRRVKRIAAMLTIGVVATTSTAWALKTLLFDGGAVTVHRGPAPSSSVPPVRGVRLGGRVSLERARARAGFVAPHVSWLDASPTAWVDGAVPEQLSLSYPPGGALPEVKGTGLGLLVQTFAGDGHEVIRKYLTTSSNSARVRIDGTDAVFLSGGEHTLFYLLPDGSYRSVLGRLVGNALILRHGALTVRIEAQLPLARLVEIARSLRR